MTNSIKTTNSLLDSESESQVPPPSMIGYRRWIELGGATELLASRTVPAPARHLSLGEAALVVDALNGTWLTFETDVFFSVADNIRFERLHEKWGVDGVILLDTLRCFRSVDVIALMACDVRWWNADGEDLPELYDASGFSRLLVPTQPVPGEVLGFGEPVDTFNRIDLAASEGSLREEELIGFLEHPHRHVREYAILRVGDKVGLN